MFAITPSDTTQIDRPYKHLYVGGAGNIAVLDKDGNTVVLTAVPVGTLLLDCCPNRIKSTGTTATNLVAI